jgi:hypothetical protein
MSDGSVAARSGRGKGPAPAAASLGLALVAERPLVVPAGRVRIAVAPGDIIRVAPGEVVEAGAAIVERLRDPRLEEVAIPSGEAELASGARVPAQPGEASAGGPATPASTPESAAGEGAGAAAEEGQGLEEGDRLAPSRADRAAEPRPPAAPAEAGPTPSGELLFRRRRRWLVVRGDRTDLGIVPVAGTVVAVEPGRAIEIEADGWWRTPGTGVLGEPTFGQLSVVPDPPDGRPPSLDVGLAGRIVVVGGRVDAETITRARAMGLRGLVVGSLAGRVWQAVVASEVRQRAALHPRPPFAVLVLDGELRRPIPSQLRVLLGALAGRSVGIVADPPGLVFADPLPRVVVPPDRVVVRAGPWAGTEGRFDGLVGIWRFALGVHLPAARVVSDAGAVLVVPVADLVRFRSPG